MLKNLAGVFFFYKFDQLARQERGSSFDMGRRCNFPLRGDIADGPIDNFLGCVAGSQGFRYQGNSQAQGNTVLYRG